MKTSTVLFLLVVLIFCACSNKDTSSTAPTTDEVLPQWTRSELPQAAVGTWYEGGAEEVVIAGDSLHSWDNYRYLKYRISSVEESEGNHYRLILSANQQYRLAEFTLVHPDTMLFGCSSSSEFSASTARELKTHYISTLTSTVGWHETQNMPEGIQGNWLASDSTSELIIREDSIIWGSEQWRLACVQWIPGITRRLIGVRGIDTLAVYPAQILSNEMAAAVRAGSVAPLDRRGKLLADSLDTFTNWVYPFGGEIPSAGTRWLYSYYYKNYSYSQDYSERTHTRRGTLELEVISAGSGDFSLQRTIHLDTLHIYSVDTHGGIGPPVILDSLATGIELRRENIELSLYDKAYWIELNSEKDFLLTKYARDGTSINGMLFDYEPMTVEPQDGIVTSGVSLESGKGIIKLDFLRISTPFHSGYRYELKCELLEYTAGS